MDNKKEIEYLKEIKKLNDIIRKKNNEITEFRSENKAFYDVINRFTVDNSA